MPPDPERGSSDELNRLRRKLRVLDAIVEGTTDAVFAKDLEGRYLMINAAGAAFCRQPVDAILGRTDAEVFPADVGRELMEHDRRIVRGGVPVTVEEPMVIDGRETIWYSMKAPFRDESGEVVGLIGISRDITQLRASERERHRLELESQAYRSQKLESLGVLAGGIAHDFNNLLVGILGNADLALDQLPSNSQVRELIEDIKTAGKGAAELCREMLAYSGKGHFVVRPLDLNELAREMRSLLRASSLKRATLDFDLSPELPAVVADASQLRQVILNLVTNASEALAGEGAVTLRTRALRHGPSEFEGNLLDAPLPAGEYASLVVADTGEGMDAETLRRIFDPFFSTKRAGRGLGLAAVLGIVRGHRGGLRVRSEPGRGTTFEILLPASEALPVAEPAAPPPSAWRGCGTVLLVDDEETVRRVGVRMLESLGFSVLTAESGEEALRVFAARGGELACVLLDLTMPGLSGAETYSRLRESREDVVVILSSGFSEHEFETRYAGSGLAGFVPKPYELSTLQRTLREVLNP